MTPCRHGEQTLVVKFKLFKELVYSKANICNQTYLEKNKII